MSRANRNKYPQISQICIKNLRNLWIDRPEKVIDRHAYFLLHSTAKAFHPNNKLRNSIRKMYICVSAKSIHIVHVLFLKQETR